MEREFLCPKTLTKYRRMIHVVNNAVRFLLNITKYNIYGLTSLYSLLF